MNHTEVNSERGIFMGALQKVKLRPNLAFGIIILTALLAFESFNYSTTDYALRDLLGNLKFAGIRWATILSIAFCGIDFAGIARLFTPEQGADEPKEVWYLFGAWLLAATMNAILTWWGVSMAVANHPVASSQTVVDQSTLTKIVPVFVAIMVWVIRILIIGSLSYAGDHFFAAESKGRYNSNAVSAHRTAAPSQKEYASPSVMAPRPVVNHPTASPRTAAPQRPAPRPSIPTESPSIRPEPTYHSISARPVTSRPSPIGDNPDFRSH
jgi:hypothetical protein